MWREEVEREWEGRKGSCDQNVNKKMNFKKQLIKTKKSHCQVCFTTLFPVASLLSQVTRSWLM